MDSITIATAPRLLLTKQWLRNASGELVSVDYDRAKKFRFRSQSVASISDLARVLDGLMADPHSAVLRGEPKPGTIGKLVRRLLKDQPGDKATLESVARSWLLLDFDTVPLPEGADWIADPEGIVRYAVSYLPAEFSDVTCWWSFTSSMGLKSGLRMRLAFWLDRALTGRELKSWLRDTPVDKAVFGDAQLIYVAAPIFEYPEDDPFRNGLRSGLLIGTRDSAAAPPGETLKRPPQSRFLAEAREIAGGSWRMALRFIGDGDDREGFYEPIKVVLGRYFQENGSRADASPLRTALAETISSAPRNTNLHDDNYVAHRIADLDSWIEWTRNAQAESEAKKAAELANADYPWPLERMPLAAGENLLALNVATFFEFWAPDAKEICRRRADYEAAHAEWQDRKRDWDLLQEFGPGDDIFAEREFPEPPPEPPRGFERVGLKVTAGVGKTTTVIRELAERIKKNRERAVYAVPSHSKGKEIAAEFTRMGIDAETWQGAGYPADDPSCRRAEELARLAKAGGYMADLCGKCPFHPKNGGDCAYKLQQAKRPDVWVIPHATLRFEPRMADHAFDWLVIDEAYTPRVETMNISLEHLCMAEDNGRRRNSAEYEIAIGKLRNVLETHPAGPLRRELFESFDPEDCKYLAGSVMADRIPPVDVAEDELDRVGKINDRVMRRHVFWTLLGELLFGDRDVGGRLFWTGAEVIMQVPDRIAKGWLKAHVLLIDATLDEHVAQQWLPGLRVWERIEVESLAHVRFVTNARVTYNRIIPGSPDPSVKRTQENNLRHIWHRIEVEAGIRSAYDEQVLVVLPKGAEDWIRQQYGARLPSNLHFTHYGALRGLNSFEQVSKVFVISRPQPPVTEIERSAAAIFDRPVNALPTGYLEKRYRHLPTRDSRPIIVPFDAHPDTDTHAMLEQTREAEIEQAAHRSRPVRRRCEIDLLSVVAVNLTVDEAVEFDEWIGEGNIVTLALARGVLPETQTEFARVVSDVCGYREIKNRLAGNSVARRDFAAAVRAANEGKTPISIELYRRFALIQEKAAILPPWRRFRAKISGKRKSFRIWVTPAVTDPREVAERYLGDLQEWIEMPLPKPREGHRRMEEDLRPELKSIAAAAATAPHTVRSTPTPHLVSAALDV